MNITRIIKLAIGPVLVAAGLYLAVTGYRSMDTTGQKIKREFTGNYSHHLKRNIVGGIALVLIGGVVFYYIRGRK